MVLDRVFEDISVAAPIFMEAPAVVETQNSKEAKTDAEVQLPTESMLPEKYQRKSEELVGLMEAKEKEFLILEQRVDEFERVSLEVRDDFEAVLNEKPDEMYVQKAVKELQTKILTELQKLIKIRQRLMTNGDATSMLNIPSSHAAESYRYGPANNPLQWIDQRTQKNKPGYDRGKEDFHNYQWVLFNQRVDELSERLRQYAGRPETTNDMPSCHGWDIASEQFETDTIGFGKAAKEKAEHYREKHHTSVNKRAVIEEISRWLQGDWAKNINLASKWTNEVVGLEEMGRTTEYLMRMLGEDEQRVRSWVEGYGFSARNYKGALLGKALDVGDQLSESMFEREYNNSEMITSDMEYEDYLWLLPYCGASLEEFTELRKLNEWLNRYLAKHKIELGVRQNRIANLVNNLTALSEANKKFPESQDLMWHVAQPTIMIDKIIVPGELLSRAEQMKRYGEATFFSANMKARKLEGDQYELTQDFFPYSTRVVHMSRDELSNERGAGGKHWFEEYNQICFSREYSYFRDNLDIAICFSKTSLLTNRQFMLADGWHVFDEEYQGSPESPGFQIDLNSEPHLLVVVKSQALPELTKKLQEASEQGRLLGGKETVEDWVTQHVMIVDSFMNEDDRRKVKQEFHTRFNINKKPGYFIPSGVSAPETPGVHTPKPLVTYKSS